jgi:epoxyqueuosine reductase
MLSSGELKVRAKELGFTDIGVARACTLEKEAVLFDEWCARGFDATMGWMKRRREERRNVSAVLNGVRSVIVVSVNYAAPPGDQSGPDVLKVSQYARGTDYHAVIGGRIEALMQWIRTREPGTEGKWYVDTGPLFEKAWAVRAGIGWQGKHTNVITKHHGSLVFLGVLLTTLDLDPDMPATDQCGTCTRCLDACPTQALVAPYVLDARRCISYLTIENRGEIPEEFAEGCGTWVFGCDVCQDVCPWNIKFTQPSDDPAWADGIRAEMSDPDALQTMTAGQFAVKFRDSAILRARWEGFMRNVRNAMKNIRGKGSDPPPAAEASYR